MVSAAGPPFFFQSFDLRCWPLNGVCKSLPIWGYEAWCQSQGEMDGHWRVNGDFVFWSLATRTLWSGWFVCRLGHWVTHPGPWRDSRPLWFLLLRSAGGILLLVRPISKFTIKTCEGQQWSVANARCFYDFSWLRLFHTFRSFSWMHAAVSDRKEQYALSCRSFLMRAWSSMTTGNYVSMTFNDYWTGSFDPDNL